MNNQKVRIYDLSKELNLENKDILAICDDLNIAVKSHSSTITEEDAQRIRASAPPQSVNNPPPNGQVLPSPSSGNSSSQTRPRMPHGNKKLSPKPQQILAVRSRQNEDSSQTSVDSQTLSVTPTPPRPKPVQRSSYAPKDGAGTSPTVLKGPPQRTNEPVVDGENPVQSVAPMDESLAPSVSHGPQESFVDQVSTGELGTGRRSEATPFDNTIPLSQKPQRPDRPNPSQEATVNLPTPPAIVPPPRRPQATPPASPAAKDGNRKPIPPKDSKDTKEPRVVKDKPVLAKNKPTIAKDKPSGPPKDREKTARPGGNRAPGRSGEREEAASTKLASPPQVMELRRPRPMRPTDINPTDDEDLTLTSAVSGTETDGPVEELEKPRLRRPMEPSKVTRKKSRLEEEEDEREASRKAAKVASKNKRRTYILDEEDDFDESDDQENSVSAAAMNISLARPPKPKSAKITSAAKPAPTMAKRRSSGSGGRDNRQRRDRQVQEVRERPEMLSLHANMTVQDLAEELMISETEIIKTLFMKGIVATITQTLDIATIQMVAEENGVLVEETVEESKAKKTMQVLDAGDFDNLHRRPPVVTVMGHVDHGKTSLLDAIRKTRVAQGEAGGITQHIGAYHVDVEHNGQVQQVVFLDTPGHEAFTAMRARGARVTDLAILVVAADDGVRPQTIEAISHAKAAQVPLIVAINKVDKEEAQPDRVKQELTEYGLLAEDWGGDTIMVPVSAIKGENLDTLLEMILLVSEVEELSANPDRLAKGSVIEAHLDKARGPVATLLVQNGTLRVGDVLVAGSVFGKVRAMINDRGERVGAAGPSIPVEVLGLSDVPAAGDEFEAFADEKEARSVASDRADTQRVSRLQQAMSSRRVSLNSISAQAQEGDLKELNLILKADVQGSVEAILGALEQISQREVQLRVLLAAPGEVTETDVDLAAASGAVILGFNTTLASGSKRAADEAGVDVREYDIIYKLLEDVQGAMEGLLEPELVEEPLGWVEVRAVFPVGRNAVAGCYIQSGKATRNCHVRVHRQKEVIYTGTLDSLRRMKEDVKEVNSGYECGIGLDHFNAWQEGDLLETFRMVTKRRTLSQ